MKSKNIYFPDSYYIFSK